MGIHSHRWFVGKSLRPVRAESGCFERDSEDETSQTSVKLGRVRRLVYMRTGSNIPDGYSWFFRERVILEIGGARGIIG